MLMILMTSDAMSTKKTMLFANFSLKSLNVTKLDGKVNDFELSDDDS